MFTLGKRNSLMEKEENGVVERHWRFELEDIPASVMLFDLIQKYSSNQTFIDLSNLQLICIPCFRVVHGRSS